ncbi:hypothetical protein XarbCFBP7604_09180 [Xanthomonas arboricola]|nr:hypothetical protein XarbCFBP7604_09180 [Xanthomonas arboricola]
MHGGKRGRYHASTQAVARHNDQNFPREDGWQKMQVTHWLPNGNNINIHYQYNERTGKAYDMKVLTPQYDLNPSGDK